jgi:hypothetical protein
LQHEAFTGGGFGELLAKLQNLPTGDQRGKLAQLRQGAFESGWIGVIGLLKGLILAPGIGTPLHEVLR